MKGIQHEDSVAYTVRNAVIRDETGNLRIRQCHPKTACDKPVSQHIKAFDNKTVGDILNKLKFNNSLRSIVRS